jgi:protein CpxP
MKKLWIIGLFILGVTAMAQPGPDHSNDHKGAMKEKMKDLTPQQRATLKTKQMTLDLDLTATQQENIYTANETFELQMEAFRKEHKSDQELSSEELFSHKSEKLDAEIDHKQQLKTILSEDQLAKWEKQRSHCKEKGKDKPKKKRN